MTTLSPGTAFLLACLPARRVAQAARRELLDRKAGDINRTLQIEFTRATHVREDSMAAEVDQRLADLAGKAGIALAPLPPAAELPAWLAALPGRVRPFLTTAPLQAAWAAGEIGWLVSISAHQLARVAYLRSAAPEDAALRKQAEDCARDLKESASMLTDHLKATGLPLVISHAGNVAEMVSLTRNLTPSTPGGYHEIDGLARDLDRFLATKARELDVSPPPQVSEPPSAEEEALLARIVASPGDLRLRLEFAALAERRNDQRARLIRLQLGIGDDSTHEAHDLIQSHPEWTARLVELGARKIKFAGGFPDEITIDAEVLLARGSELLKAAPLRRLHVRTAKGRVAEIVRSPLLATIEALDLDDQGVTDGDVIALAASPHAARLRQLDLRYNPLSATGIESLAASQHLKRLEMVNLDGNPADPVDRLEYYDETNQHAVPTEAGKALQAKHGKLRWLQRG
jgi:uncharacterized protein (TIGR02996 family)